MLKEIESLLRERGPIAARDIAVHLDSTPDAVDGMLKLLERKGHIKRLSMDCGQGCAGCLCDSPAGDVSARLWVISE